MLLVAAETGGWEIFPARLDELLGAAE